MGGGGCLALRSRSVVTGDHRSGVGNHGDRSPGSDEDKVTEDRRSRE